LRGQSYRLDPPISKRVAGDDAIEEHDDLVAAVARVVRERNTTYIMVGESQPVRGWARPRERLPQRLMQATPPGVDVRIVAHRGLKEDEK
jgi:K+-sensing histidine kinase KdpD